MAKIIPITYNGEVGNKATVGEVFIFLSFLTTDNFNLTKFLDFVNPVSNLKNREVIWRGLGKKQLIALGLMNQTATSKYDSYTPEQINDATPCPVPIIFYIDTK